MTEPGADDINADAKGRTEVLNSEDENETQLTTDEDVSQQLSGIEATKDNEQTTQLLADGTATDDTSKIADSTDVTESETDRTLPETDESVSGVSPSEATNEIEGKTKEPHPPELIPSISVLEDTAELEREIDELVSKVNAAEEHEAPTITNTEETEEVEEEEEEVETVDEEEALRIKEEEFLEKERLESEFVKIEMEEMLARKSEASHTSLTVEDQPEIRGLTEIGSSDSLKEASATALIDEARAGAAMKRLSVRGMMAQKLMSRALHGKKGSYKAKDESEDKPDEILDFLEEEIEEEEEEEDDSSKREALYVIYEELTPELAQLRIRNKVVQRKVADYFKKRKADYVLREEIDISEDTVRKYEESLDRLDELTKMYATEMSAITDELNLIKTEKCEKEQERHHLITKMANKERDTGTGLINTKTGQEISDEIVDLLVRRKSNSFNQIAELRLKYIIGRNELAARTAELKSLDNIGDDLSLMDYEQLKIENRAHSDKLEEREEELSKLRVKCRNAVQIMAHIREKSSALDVDMDGLKEEYDEVHLEHLQMRERLNFFKTERDEVRRKTESLKADSGLLTKPKLLLDMETSMEEAQLYKETLENIKNEYTEKTQQIRILRKNIAYAQVFGKRQHREKKKKTDTKFFDTRPTLLLPEIPKDVLEKLLKNAYISTVQNKKG